MTPVRLVVAAAALSFACQPPPPEQPVPPSTLVIVNETPCQVELDSDDGLALTAPGGATAERAVDSAFCTYARIDAGTCSSTVATRPLCFDGNDVCVVTVEPAGDSVNVTTSDDCETGIVLNDELL